MKEEGGARWDDKGRLTCLPEADDSSSLHPAIYFTPNDLLMSMVDIIN